MSVKVDINNSNVMRSQQTAAAPASNSSWGRKWNNFKEDMSDRYGDSGLARMISKIEMKWAIKSYYISNFVTSFHESFEPLQERIDRLSDKFYNSTIGKKFTNLCNRFDQFFKKKPANLPES